MKTILILGGGISGLAALHFLKKKYANQPDVKIILLEKNDYAGGTIRSLGQSGCLFETGPNGFLNTQPRTFEFIEDLNLTDQVIEAKKEANIRYISVQKKLYRIPANPKAFLNFPLLNLKEKFRVLFEILAPKKDCPDETVFDFGCRRLGRRFTELFLDPVVSGIYGGDIQKISLKLAFPKLYQMEQRCGSLTKALFGSKRSPFPKAQAKISKGKLYSFKKGMGELIDRLATKYTDEIRLKEEAISIRPFNHQYEIISSIDKYLADELFVCTPAYVSSNLLKDLDLSLTKALEKINYAPIAVAGLLFRRNQFPDFPPGFGYLIPSKEGRDILGVLFDSQIFNDRSPDDNIFVRVMLAGSLHPEILKMPANDIFKKAIEEIRQQLELKGDPQEVFLSLWPKAIPQYDADYAGILPILEEKLTHFSHIHIVSNFLKGVSMNDCVENAYQAAQKLPF